MAKVFYAPAVGYLGYDVATDGSIWSYWGPGGKHEGSLQITRKPLSLNSKIAGYPVVGLKTSKGKHRVVPVHLLVLAAFIGPRPDGMEACHRNGDRGDARLGNLRWGSRKSNHRDQYRHGTRIQGESHPGAKITEEDVRLLRYLRDVEKTTFRELGERFGIHLSTAHHIYTGHLWGHISDG